jgi:hypothetical protein
MPSFRLVHVSGEDLGVKMFAVPDWKVGDTITLGGGTLRVVGAESGNSSSSSSSSLRGIAGSGEPSATGCG